MLSAQRGRGKHILVDKPLAITMADALAIVAAAQDAGVHLITGPSHSFDQPIETARALIASGEYGPVRMIHAMNYTDFLYRPRVLKSFIPKGGRCDLQPGDTPG